ncbi:MAG: acetyl-CoA carboxylase biotin carboxyl carrier protein [Magnetococcales bacterium]|nr:acetyl-CoA carboxylase biotin carboxyl carrier protein [Magnetococcales bacterium]
MDLKEIRQLIRFLSGTDVSEIEITEEGQTVRINRASVNAIPPSVTIASAGPIAGLSPTQQPVVSVSTPEQEEEGCKVASGPTINSPMVGTFYLAPSPESPQFVSVGDRVQKGQVVCIVEAMKLMNEIESEVSGKIVRIIKDNASPVEYGEPLFEVEVN